MSQNELTTRLESLRKDIEELKSKVKAVEGKFTSRKNIRDQAKDIATTWFKLIMPSLPNYGIDGQCAIEYELRFDRLLDLGNSRNSRTRTYLSTLDEILKNYKKDLLIPIQRHYEPTNSLASLRGQFMQATEVEKKYLREAFDCAERGWLRASLVMGWCAFVHRMHKVVEKRGFDEFSRTTTVLKEAKGRYRWFTRDYEVSTISEFRSLIPDSALMHVLEYWGYLESNQHERMKRNYDMRNQAAHPGEAPITEENLLSFYSDLREIVYNNPKFSL
jgi:hypothetical protein